MLHCALMIHRDNRGQRKIYQGNSLFVATTDINNYYCCWYVINMIFNFLVLESETCTAAIQLFSTDLCYSNYMYLEARFVLPVQQADLIHLLLDALCTSTRHRNN